MDLHISIDFHVSMDSHIGMDFHVGMDLHDRLHDLDWNEHPKQVSLN